MKRAILLVGTSLALGACGYTQGSLSNDVSFMQQAALTDVPGYDDVARIVFEKNCTRCHGDAGGVNLESYDGAKASLAKIEKVMRAKSMPKRGMADANYELVLAWIAGKAPQKTLGKPKLPDTVVANPAPGAPKPPVTQPAPAPKPPSEPPVSQPAPPVQNPPVVVTPPPVTQPAPPTEPPPVAQPPAPAAITFAEISQKIFVPKCVQCHSPEGRASDYDFTSYEMFVAGDVVQPGHPANSPLYKLVVAESPDKAPKMPPKKSGIAPLDAAELALLKTWIEQGAPK